MDKKELTDEEIVKALEICAKDKGCGKCPYKLKDIDCGIGQRSENDYLKLIQRLQKDYANLKERYIKVLDLNEKVITDQKAEIERLTEDNEVKRAQVGLLENQVKFLKQYCDDLQERVDGLEKDNHDLSWIVKIHKYCVGADHCQNSSTKEFELQKQVDELTEELEKAYEIERANIQAEIAEAGTSCHWCEQQTVKGTAKEILTELKPIIIAYLEEYMINGDEEAPKYFNELCGRYGVEVE